MKREAGSGEMSVKLKQLWSAYSDGIRDIRGKRKV